MFPALQNILLYHVLAGRESVPELLSRAQPRRFKAIPSSRCGKASRCGSTGRKWITHRCRPRTASVHPIKGRADSPGDGYLLINSMVDVLALDGRFTTLIAAVQAAGLTDALTSGDRHSRCLRRRMRHLPLCRLARWNRSSRTCRRCRNICCITCSASEVSAVELLGRHSVETLQGETVSTAVKNGAACSLTNPKCSTERERAQRHHTCD